jgi:prepilin-type processing-associated H-X9-DG protein
MRRPSPRVALTLLELVVVLAIGAVVLALLLSAVMQARAAADRARCQSNLRQIGLAFHQYHDSYNAFPPAQLNDPTYQPGSREQRPTYPYLSWRGYLLPFIEQNDLWRRTEGAFRQTPDFWSNPPHVGLNMRLAVYTCPSDAREGMEYQPPYPDLYPGGQGQLAMSPVTLSGYLAVSGTNLASKDGVVFYNGSTNIQQIKDGTSNTVMVGERPAIRPYIFGWWYAGVGQFEPDHLGPAASNLAQRIAFQGVFTGSAARTLGAAELNRQSSGYSAYDNCPPGPYGYGPGRQDNPCDAFHFWSLHPGGANFLYGDGSVKLLSYSIGADLVKLATRAGGETYNGW